MNILIIEDEAMSAEDLTEIVQKANPEITIVATLESVKESIDYLKPGPDIDLIFSDIQLGDGLSFEIFNTVSISTPIIFCTAYDQYALEAFKSNGIDYVLKPFNDQSIISALNKFSRLKDYFKPSVIDYGELIRQLGKTSKSPAASVLIYQKDKVFPLKLEEIALFYIANEITHVVCLNKKTYIISQKLDELEAIAGSRFFRVNRQYLINKVAIRDAEVYFHRKYVVNLSIDFEDKIIVSKNRVSAFFPWLTQA
jgi:two-component system response regulator LytT